MRLNSFYSAVALLAMLLSGNSHALPDDRAQPIRITADSASRDERSGETRYSGNVMLTQGTLQILADDVVVAHTTDDANTIIATGSPATLTQQPAADQAPINAEASRIEYRRDLDQVTLTENARIEQDGAIVTGAVINYLVAEQRVKASGDKSSGEGQRVEVIIPPSALENPPSKSSAPENTTTEGATAKASTSEIPATESSEPENTTAGQNPQGADGAPSGTGTPQ